MSRSGFLLREWTHGWKWCRSDSWLLPNVVDFVRPRGQLMKAGVVFQLFRRLVVIRVKHRTRPHQTAFPIVRHRTYVDRAGRQQQKERPSAF
ncbi:hypothetical protein CBM2595_A10085 [Cupriavidus taiwanensis]|nr:hypothetical protein CBM2595_A10085 [Cupriavidus taiwanensis]